MPAEDKRGLLSPVPKGPKSSQPKKRKPKAKTKLSQRTRSMLKAPESPAQREEPEPVKMHNIDEYLPGLPASSGSVGFLHCAGAYDMTDNRCLAPVSTGKRCKRQRHRGNFCKQHYLEWSSSEKHASMWTSIQDTWTMPRCLGQWFSTVGVQGLVPFGMVTNESVKTLVRTW